MENESLPLLRRKRLMIALLAGLGGALLLLLLFFALTFRFQYAGMKVVRVGLEDGKVKVWHTASANSSNGYSVTAIDKDGNMAAHYFVAFKQPLPLRSLLYPNRQTFGGGFMDGETEAYLAQGKPLYMRVYNIRWKDWEGFKAATELFDENGSLLPEIASIARLVWEGTVE